jgi:hypothetical protein
MSDIDDLLTTELRQLPAKPSEQSKQSEKKRYSELMSAAAARALGEALRRKGLKGTLPLLGGEPAPARPDEAAAGDEMIGHGDDQEIEE